MPGVETQYDNAFRKALSEGAIWVSFRQREFYRPGPRGLQVAAVDVNGNLGPWERWWPRTPPKDVIKL